MRRAKIIAGMVSGAGAVALTAAGLTFGSSVSAVAASSGQTPTVSGFNPHLTAALACSSYSPRANSIGITGSGITVNLLGAYVLVADTDATISSGCFLPGTTVTFKFSSLLSGTVTIGTAAAGPTGVATIGYDFPIVTLLGAVTATGRNYANTGTLTETAAVVVSALS